MQRIEHAILDVRNLTEATRFYTEVFGLVELARSNGTVYLGCGLTDRFDLALEEGGTGVDHFAIRLSAGQFDDVAGSISEHSRWTERTDEAEPGQMRGLRFPLPSGVEMEIVTVDDDRYPHVSDTAHPDRQSISPLDLDHINLMSTDPKADAEFLEQAVGFTITEEQGDWRLVFTRFGDRHHDVGISSTDDPSYTLHHLAWTLGSFDHIKQLADKLAHRGYELEMGVSRHLAGNNLYAYFQAPGGNRIEVCTEMAEVTEDTPTLHRDRAHTATSWGGIQRPDSFSEGS